MPTSQPTPPPHPSPSRPADGPKLRHDRFADGSVKASGFELDGKLHGHWEWFRLDGSLLRSGEFDLGQQVGMWRTWDRSGRMVKETSFAPAPAADAASSPADPTAG
ncbi:hypothetical protein BJQ94_05520 [Cryobacterium sp. SO2]|uniref:toxin-antitoxin system YwqK family antitoxin n=1 Tax=Cryobacterium sp. SO2 TaxID=1897060 RepID=UPI00223D88F7|nr:hypothetical protein [Cryobacterium sp. SO2]WEO78496.1 hypothetical protein BJQ94_05520 [Cryobacterium sp. SO2]